MQSVALSVKEMYTYLVVQLVAILQNTRPDFSGLNVGPTVRCARSVKQQSRVAKLYCSLDQPTQSGQFGFSITLCGYMVKVFKTLNGRHYYIISKFHKIERF